MSEQLAFLGFDACEESAVASLARMSLPPASDGASPGPALASGTNTPESSTKSPPSGSSSKTSRAARLRGCPMCGTISCDLAIARRPTGLELWTWGRRTAACGPSCWASPMAADARGRAGPGREASERQLSNQIVPWATPVRRDGDGGSSGPARRSMQLRDEVKLWATPTRTGNTNRKGCSPTSQDGLRTQVVDLWPTPTASTGGYNQEGGSGREGQPIRPSLRMLTRDGPRLLSARWVECLMGFPPDWTAIDGPPAVAKRSAKKSRRGRSRGAKLKKTPRASGR